MSENDFEEFCTKHAPDEDYLCIVLEHLEIFAAKDGHDDVIRTARALRRELERSPEERVARRRRKEVFQDVFLRGLDVMEALEEAERVVPLLPGEVSGQSAA